ncbi:MAG: hypothetical protein H6P98_1876, partial [Candidatus Aminicenantes bacterium]|nr:hypothetical protein [Candidatus Aminicenantes bacterium]
IDLGSGLFRLNLWKAVFPYWERGGVPGILSAAAMTGIILLMTWVLTRQKVIIKI